MFDTGGMAGQVVRAHALLADVTASISVDTSGPVAREALVEALALGRQVDLAICLLSERVDRSGEFAADGSISMAAWLRHEGHASREWASLRIHTGRALVDLLPATRRRRGLAGISGWSTSATSGGLSTGSAPPRPPASTKHWPSQQRPCHRRT